MKKVLGLLFPYSVHLSVLQLEGYDLWRFLAWIGRNFKTRELERKKPLVWTSKIKLILAYSVVINLILMVFIVKIIGGFGFVISLVLNTQPWFFLAVGTLINLPKEWLVKRVVKTRIKNKIQDQKSKGLKVIGITGSYGKTSTKEILYQILLQKYKVLRTPESYNTLFGIKKVVDLELYDGYDYFIVEMGAYKRGEIKELCEICMPDYALLTGINEQHLERFGSIENTIKAKFELVEALSDCRNAVINYDCDYIRNEFHKYCVGPVLYGSTSPKYSVSNLVFTDTGSRFLLKLGDTTASTITPLIGYVSVQNVLAASTLAYILGVSKNEIASTLGTLKPIEHRLELKKLQGGNILIDDSYSSNRTGFEMALKTLKTYRNYKRILVTPGIVELGKLTKGIHISLGTLIDQSADHVFLIGRNERTITISEGLSDMSKVTFLNTVGEFLTKLTDGTITNSVVLLENDLPDNY